MNHYLNTEFWVALDELVENSEIIIDRPKGTTHPKYPDFIYKVDYGYLKNTSSMDGDGIDVWVGSDTRRQLDAIMCIVDLTKRDSEIKILIGCTKEEKEIVYNTHNETEFMKGILIKRKGLTFPKDDFNDWLDHELSHYVRGLIGICFTFSEKGKHSWEMEMVQTSSFSEEDSTWIFDELYRNIYYPFKWTEAATREEVQEHIKAVILEYIENGYMRHRLLSCRGVGISFADCQPEIICTMCNYDRFIEDICSREDVENGDYSNLNGFQKKATMVFWYDAIVNGDGHESYFLEFTCPDKDFLEKALREIANEEILNNFLMASNTEDEEIWNQADDKHYKFNPQLNDFLEKYIEEHLDEIFV